MLPSKKQRGIMNRKQHLNKTICKLVMRHGVTCLIQNDNVYVLVPFVTDSGYKGRKIVRVQNIAHAYRIIGF